MAVCPNCRKQNDYYQTRCVYCNSPLPPSELPKFSGGRFDSLNKELKQIQKKQAKLDAEIARRQSAPQVQQSAGGIKGCGTLILTVIICLFLLHMCAG